MTEIQCPVCSLSYELPPRYLRRTDEIDYTNVPRLLDCLHSCCHSCLEDSFQRTSTIACPICAKKQDVKGVRFLPLNASILTRIISLKKTSIYAFCCR